MAKKSIEVASTQDAESSQIVKNVLAELRERLQTDTLFDHGTLTRLEKVIANGKLKRARDVEQAILGD